MPRSNALVDEVLGIGRPTAITLTSGTATPSGTATVAFAGGVNARLDMSQRHAPGWLAALEQMRSAGLNAYVEIDPDTAEITTLLCPIEVGVGAMHDRDDAVEVELEVSHARHRIRRDNPDFEELRAALEAARQNGTLVLVTETLDDHAIIDVRPLPKAVPRPTDEVAAADSEPVLGRAVSLGTAQQMFDLVNGRVCCSAGPSAPCIPFTFPDDGCWGRAHEMCRLIQAAGIQPGKVWIYGSLHVVSANKPNCHVYWGWHVAPTLSVDTGSGVQTYVVDPALFTGPVTQSAWAGVQGDPNPTLVPTSADVFHRSFGGSVSYDPTYSQTNSVLSTYRAQLQLRSASGDGPPPYANCEPNPPGVQWRGTIEPGATRRWFTYGWPAGWHMLWTIMPTSICSGAPQLSWSVAVERASATQCTYWITVKNQTSRTVRFEGRYDILSR